MKNFLKLAAVLATAASLQAGDAGLQISLIPDIALQPTTATIHGLSLNLLCGENEQHGVTLGVVNLMTGNSSGFSWGLVNKSDSYTGFHLGVLNVCSENFCGWQDGGFNYTGREFRGFQSGIINYAGDCKGLQLGLVNCTEKLHGLQAGVLNISTQNRWFTEFPNELAAAFPIVNWSF